MNNELASGTPSSCLRIASELANRELGCSLPIGGDVESWRKWRGGLVDDDSRLILVSPSRFDRGVADLDGAGKGGLLGSTVIDGIEDSRGG